MGRFARENVISRFSAGFSVAVDGKATGGKIGMQVVEVGAAPKKTQN
jgi:hypothetical protein